jgi:hypothetical protein
MSDAGFVVFELIWEKILSVTVLAPIRGRFLVYGRAVALEGRWLPR